MPEPQASGMQAWQQIQNVSVAGLFCFAPKGPGKMPIYAKMHRALSALAEIHRPAVAKKEGFFDAILRTQNEQTSLEGVSDMKNDLKNMDQRVSVRLPGEIARALDKYCEDNYMDRSTVLRTALIHWGPLQKYLNAEKEGLKDLTSVVEAFLEMENLGIDYESFSSGDELADYLDGLKLPGFDEPIQITQLQREGLREIYAKRS